MIILHANMMLRLVVNPSFGTGLFGSRSVSKLAADNLVMCLGIDLCCFDKFQRVERQINM